jgi:adenylate kinase
VLQLALGTPGMLLLDASNLQPMLNIALFGPPGAGKGTQSEFLIKKYNLFYISTGDLLRKEMANKTKLGLEAQSIIAPAVWFRTKSSCRSSRKPSRTIPARTAFLFDGFPRTYIQAYILEGLMLKLNTSLNCLISLTCAGRGIASGGCCSRG